jgi:hypothetical protein
VLLRAGMSLDERQHHPGRRRRGYCGVAAQTQKGAIHGAF